MEQIAVVLDDAAHARRTLAPLLAPGAAPTRWLLLPRAPRLHRHAARFTTPAGRAAWRDDWNRRLRQSLQPWLDQAPAGACFDWQAADRALPDLIGQLRLQHGSGLRVLDARLPRPGRLAEPLLRGQAPAGQRLAAPIALTSALSVVLALTD